MAAPTEGEAQALIDRIAASRITAARDIVQLRNRFDLSGRVKESIRAKPATWFGGSLGAGFAASMVLRRPRRRDKVPSVRVEKEKTRRSLMSIALGGAFALARPLIQKWAVNQVRRRFVIPGNDNVRRS